MAIGMISTYVCLKYLFHKVAEGGLIIIDDYYTWDGCSRAIHDFLSHRSAPERVRNLNSVAYIVKERNIYRTREEDNDDRL